MLGRSVFHFTSVRRQNFSFNRKLSKLFFLSVKTNPMDSFFAYAKNKNLSVETRNVVIKVKKHNVFSNVKNSSLSYKKNIFSNGSAIKRLGPFFAYIKRYITMIKSYFDYFIQRKYKCRIFAT